MTAFLIKLGIRFVVFAGVFTFAAHKSENVVVKPKIALPLVGLVFALLNTGLYWALSPILELATLGTMGLVIPFVLNGFFLWGTAKVLRPLEIKGIRTTIWMAVLLTAAHGALYLALDVLAK